MENPGQSDFIKEMLSTMLEKALIELNIRTFDEYIKTVGVADGMAIMRLYKKRNGYILLSMMKKQVGFKGNGLDSLVIPMTLGAMALNSNPRNVETSITEGGGVIKVHDCIFRNATPEFCVTISHFTADLICEAINPDYECIYTHQLTNGDPYCRCIYKKKGEKVNLKNPGRTITHLNFAETPEAVRRDIRNFTLSHFWDATTEAFMDLRGSRETLDHLLPVAYQIGYEMGEAFRKTDPTPAITFAMMGGTFDMLGEIMHQVGTTTNTSQDEFIKVISDCPFQTFPNEMCRQIEALYQGLTQAVNPDAEFSYREMINDGGRICSWSVRRKGITPTPTNFIEQNMAKAQDPINLLKTRLAKGEISLDEYETIKRAISEP
jgi:predicted hydrocarbon binding protein